MSLFDAFRKKYDMDSLDGIHAIPVPAKNYNTGDSTKDCIYYLLQRKATEHKNNGNMELAIACLRKSNELSDYEKKSLLTEKEYFRIVKYLEYNKQYEAASAEAERIMQKHPEFKDRRILNLPRIKETIAKNKEFGNDLVIINTSIRCPICKKYNNMIYSITGKSTKYPKLPKEITSNGGFCPNCIIGLYSYFDKVNTNL